MLNLLKPTLRLVIKACKTCKDQPKESKATKYTCDITLKRQICCGDEPVDGGENVPLQLRNSGSNAAFRS